MKKLFCIFVLAVTCCAISFAQKSYNSGQQAVRNNIESFLKSEGYQPSIDSDGDIKFKRQGDVYFISVSDKDSEPYYVRLTKYYTYGERLNKTKISMAAPEINKYKMVKLLPNENSFCLDAQLFVNSASAFTSIFDRIMQVIDAAENELSE